MAFVKNQAVTGFVFDLQTTLGAAITSGTVTGYYLLDVGTQTAIAGTPVHEGNGQWSVNLTASEMNGDLVGLLFVHADGRASFTIKTGEEEYGTLAAGNRKTNYFTGTLGVLGALFDGDADRLAVLVDMFARVGIFDLSADAVVISTWARSSTRAARGSRRLTWTRRSGS